MGPWHCSLVVAGSLLGLGGCGPTLTVSDRDDVGRDDESVRVYATGASIAFSVTSNSAFVDAASLEVTSSDEDVLTVDDGTGDVVQIITHSAGEAELVFRIDGDVVDSRRIVVRDPASVRFFLEAQATHDDDLLPDPVEVRPPLRLLQGRSARLVAHVFDDDDTELFGQAISALALDRGAGGEVGFEAALRAEGPRTAIDLGAGSRASTTTMHLALGAGALLQEVQLEGVDIALADRLVLDEGGDDGRRSPGARAVVLAYAEDANGRVLLGAPSWQLEGEDAGRGSFVDYRVALAVPGQTLLARLGPLAVTRTIYPEAGSIGDEIGCASSPATPWGLGLGIGLCWSGRRRRRRQPTPA